MSYVCKRKRTVFIKNIIFIARPTDALGPGMIQYIYAGEECK